MPADFSFFVWLWLVIPAAIGLLLVWVVALEVQQVYCNFLVWIRRLQDEIQVPCPKGQGLPLTVDKGWSITSTPP